MKPFDVSCSRCTLWRSIQATNKSLLKPLLLLPPGHHREVISACGHFSWLWFQTSCAIVVLSNVFTSSILITQIFKPIFKCVVPNQDSWYRKCYCALSKLPHVSYSCIEWVQSVCIALNLPARWFYLLVSISNEIHWMENKILPRETHRFLVVTSSPVSHSRWHYRILDCRFACHMEI